MPLSLKSRSLLAALITTLAACGDNIAAPTVNPSIRFVNANVLATQVDFALNGVILGPGQTFQSFSTCQYTQTGTYSITVTPTGSTTPILASVPITLASSGRYTFVLTGTSPATYAIISNTASIPTSGQAQVQGFNALPAGTVLDMYVTAANSSPPSGSSISSIGLNAATGFVNVASGQTDVQFTRNGSTNVLAHTGNFDLMSQQSITVIIGSAKNGTGGGAETFVVPNCQ